MVANENTITCIDGDALRRDETMKRAARKAVGNTKNVAIETI